MASATRSAGTEESATGVLFPRGADGRRGTLETNRAIWADAARAVDPGLADEIAAAGDWRASYRHGVRAVTEVGARSAEAAVAIARAGLASARARLVFARDGEERPLSEALSFLPRAELATETIAGRGAPARELEVPCRGELLRGDALRRTLAGWVERGIVEPSAARALEEVVDHPEWLRLEGRRVVVLGAGAETSPVWPLAAWGAEVVAVDLPAPGPAKRIREAAERGAGRVHVPARDGAAGADLVTDVPELAAWLQRWADAPLVLGCYVYADGARHVQATAAADVLDTHLAAAGADVTTAFAGTPSDCYLVDPEVAEDAARRGPHGAKRLLEEGLRIASAGHLLAPAYSGAITGEDGRRWAVADGIVPQQGPSYALAKRLQRWRSVVAWGDGHAASFNVAPATWTRSTTKNRLIAAGYHGAARFGVEVFSPPTMRSLMTALLVHDVHAGAPADGHVDALVARDAVHGGYWRSAHDLRSTLMLAAALGLPGAYLRPRR